MKQPMIINLYGGYRGNFHVKLAEAPINPRPPVIPRPVHKNAVIGRPVPPPNPPTKGFPVPQEVRDMLTKASRDRVCKIVYQEPPAIPLMYADDTAIIISTYGNDEKRLGNLKQMLNRIALFNPAPFVFVVEGSYDDTYHADKLCEGKSRMTHATIKLDPVSQKGIWLKEGMWSVMANAICDSEEYNGIKYFVFLDADIIPYESDYITRVRETLQKNEVASPFAYAYFADHNDEVSLRPSIAFSILEREKRGYPGFGFAMTREFFKNRLHGQFEAMPPADTMLYHKLFPWEHECPRKSRPFPTHKYAECPMNPRPLVGYVPAVIGHMEHDSNHDDNWYSALAAIHRLSASSLNELVIYNDKGLPYWIDGGEDTDEKATIFRELKDKIYELHANGDPLDPMTVKDCYEDVAASVYGHIDADHPLVIACLLRMGGRYMPNQVEFLAAEFKKYCLVPHEFVCFTDYEGTIDGVRTIPLETTPEEAPGTLAQLEFFRNLWTPNTSIMTIDLDTVVMNAFTPHVCPDDGIYMLREAFNRKDSNKDWVLWNCGQMYFRAGKFSFLYDKFKEEAQQKWTHRHPAFQYIGTQEYIAANIKAGGYYIDDLIHHFIYSFYHATEQWMWVLDGSTFIHFPDKPKAWEVTAPWNKEIFHRYPRGLR